MKLKADDLYYNRLMSISLSMNRKCNYEGIMDEAVRKIKHLFEEDDSVLEPLQEINKVLSFEWLDTLSVVTE